MTDKIIEAVARALCLENSSFHGEPACYNVDGEWPNPHCDEPGCHALAKVVCLATLKAIEEPSAAMRQRGGEVNCPTETLTSSCDYAVDVWKEMLAVLSKSIEGGNK